MSRCAAAFFVHARRWQCGVFDEVGFIWQIVLCEFRTDREENNDDSQYTDDYLAQQMV